MKKALTFNLIKQEVGSELVSGLFKKLPHLISK